MDEHCFMAIHFMVSEDEDPIKIAVPLHGVGIDNLNFPSLVAPAIEMSARGLNLHCSGGGVHYEVYFEIPSKGNVFITSGTM